MADPFSNSCDLWILPPPRLSAWFPVVDWYLNWQMSKGLAYSGLHLPTEILHLAETYEVPLPAVKTDAAAPLLVLSHGRLPAPKCVVLDSSGKHDVWLKHCFEIALNLDAKNIHVFVPNKASVDEMSKAWRTRFPDRPAQFSADSDVKGDFQ